MNERFHYDLYVTFKDGRRFIALRRTHGSLTMEVFSKEIDSTPKLLRIDAEEQWYRFSYKSSREQSEDYIEAGKVETRFIATEIAGGFTGAYFAMYASSNGAAVGSTAYFDWFDYEETAAGDPAARSISSHKTEDI